MKVERHARCLTLTGDNATLRIQYDSRGEPYQEGIRVLLDDHDERDRFTYLFLEEYEAKKLRDLLNKLYPVK